MGRQLTPARPQHRLTAQSVRDRSALLGTSSAASTATGTSYPPSRSESPFGYYPHGSGGGAGGRWGGGGGYADYPAGQRFADDLEGQNEEQLEGLSAKVKLLKDITLSIGQEARDSALELGRMNDSFESTSTFLGGTMRRLENMAGKQGGRWLCFMVFLVIVFWIFVVTWWFRR